jgi:hypothetical protein
LQFDTPAKAGVFLSGIVSIVFLILGPFLVSSDCNSILDQLYSEELVALRLGGITLSLALRQRCRQSPQE